MILEKFPEVQQLSTSEKLMVVSEQWDDLESHPADMPVASEVIAELDRRMEHFKQHPDEFATWDAVDSKIRAQILRRREAALKNPEQLQSWEGTTERVRSGLNEIRRQKT